MAMVPCGAVGPPVTVTVNVTESFRATVGLERASVVTVAAALTVTDVEPAGSLSLKLPSVSLNTAWMVWLPGVREL